MDIEKDSNREAFEAHIKSTYPMGEQLAKDCGKTLCELYSSEWEAWQAAKVESHKQAALYQFEINHLAQANQQWREKAAKAQAVPETQQALNARLLVKSIKEHVEGHIAEISVNDLFDKGWLAAMKCIKNNIDMLEAQEPTK